MSSGLEKKKSGPAAQGKTWARAARTAHNSGVTEPWREKVELERATLYRGDALAVLAALADSGVRAHALFADPPYSSGGAFRGDRTSSTIDKYVSTGSANRTRLDDFSGDNRDQRGYAHWSALWLSLARDVLDAGSPAGVFTDWRQLPTTTDALQAGGFVWRGIVPWTKPSSRPQMGRFAAQCEYLVWGSSGPMREGEDVGCLPGFFEGMAPRDRVHVTQKPVDVLERIVAIAPPDGVVLDPFMGSGTTGVAALRTGRRFIGVELDAQAFAHSVRRLREADSAGVQRELLA